MYSMGEQIYKYKLINPIGGGASGQVWLAEDKSLAKPIAVKIMDTNNISVDLRLSEAKIGSRLKHSNVVNILYADILSHNGRKIVLIAMPYFQQGSILKKVNSLNFLDMPVAIKYIIDILRGLEYLHESGFYHGDIKPNNILIGDNNQAILTDYGLTCYSPKHKVVCPRASYLPHRSPETISENTYDEKSDMYQLGLTAFRLLNGIGTIKDKFLADRNNFNRLVISGQLVTDKDFQPFIPNNLKKIIMKAIEVNPDNRYGSALEIRREFEKLFYVGYCTSDTDGKLIAIYKNYIYWHEIKAISVNKYNFKAYKKNIKTNRITQVHKYSKNNLKKSEIEKVKRKTLQAIIIGR